MRSGAKPSPVLAHTSYSHAEAAFLHSAPCDLRGKLRPGSLAIVARALAGPRVPMLQL